MRRARARAARRRRRARVLRRLPRRPPAATRCCCASSCARWRPSGVEPIAANVDVVRAVGPRAASSTVLLRLGRLPGDAVGVAARGQRARRARGAARRRGARRARRAGRGRRDRRARRGPRSCARTRRSASCTRSCATRSTASSRPASARCCTSAPRALLRDAGAAAEQVAAQLLEAPRRGAAWVVGAARAPRARRRCAGARPTAPSRTCAARWRSRRRRSGGPRCCSSSAPPRR